MSEEAKARLSRRYVASAFTNITVWLRLRTGLARDARTRARGARRPRVGPWKAAIGWGIWQRVFQSPPKKERPGALFQGEGPFSFDFSVALDSAANR